MMRLLAVSFTLALAAACAPCEDREVNLAEACLLPRMAADQELEIEVREACGTSCSETPFCTSFLDVTNGNTVTVIASQSECSLDCVPNGTCSTRTVICLLPSLAPGEYFVTLPGLASRTLTVEAGAPASCAL